MFHCSNSLDLNEIKKLGTEEDDIYGYKHACLDDQL